MAEPTYDEAIAELKRLKAQKKTVGNHALKVTEKGAVCILGLGRWPFTLYKKQWDIVLAMADDIKLFMEENMESLDLKG
jgi:hypothetical protein